MNALLHEALLADGIWSEKNGKQVTLNMDRMAALRLLDPECFQTYKKTGANRSSLDQSIYLLERDDSFTGGSLDELKDWLGGDIDLEPYTKALDKLDKNGLVSRLKTKGALSKPRRKRSRSEHEGDFDLDRMWDLKPYQKCVRIPQRVKTIKVYANFSCSGMSSSEDLMRYGSLVWGIVQIIENAGIQVEVYYREVGIGVDSGESVDVLSLIQVKKPGEYLSPQALAAVFTSNFYRRLGFAIQSLAVALDDKKCSSSMGRAKPAKQSIVFKDGALHLDVKAHLVDYEVIEKEIMKVINPKEKEEK